MADRHLAGAKSAQVDALLEFIQPLGQARFEIGRRNLDLKLAPEAFGKGFGHFHGGSPNMGRWRGGVEMAPLPGLVRAEGFEPPRLSSREPKSRASASSATPARADLSSTSIAGLTGIGPAG